MGQNANWLLSDCGAVGAVDPSSKKTEKTGKQ